MTIHPGSGVEQTGSLPTQNCADEDDFDDGYRQLVINTDVKDAQTFDDQPTDSNAHSVKYSAANLPFANKVDPYKPDPGQTVTGSNLNLDSAHYPKDTHSPHLLRGAIATNCHSNEEPPATNMTLGGMEYTSDDSQGTSEHGGRLLTSPAVYHGGNTPATKPRQPTPSKTRRKSDKIVPVVTPEGQKFICPVCKVSLTSNNELTVHIRSHNTTSAINTCTICGKVLSSQSSLDRHMLVHSGERPFKCKICDMSFTTNGNMHRHFRIHKKDGQSHSPANSVRSDSPKELVKKSRRSRPMNMMSLPSQSRCGLKRKFDSEVDVSTQGSLLGLDSLETSRLMDRESAEQFASPDKASAVPFENNSQALSCPMCLQSFMCKYGLDAHFGCHENEPGICQICQTTMQSSKLVYLHYFVAHVDKKKLQELTQSQSSVKNGITPLATGFHDISFADFTAEKFTHQAKVWCEKNQRRSNSILQNFHCHKCDHAFPSEEALKMHSDNHPDVCDVTCKSCNVSFVTKQEFEDHLLQHSSEKIIDAFSKKVGTDDNDIQDMISQPEFFLCLGLKSTKNTMEWCSANTIARAAKYHSAITTATKIQGKPVNHVTPIVIQPEGDISPVPLLPQNKENAHSGPFAFQTHPAFANSYASLAQGQQRAEKGTVEIYSSSDGETDEDVENATDVKPYQCIICEFAYSIRGLCEKHCRTEHSLSTPQEISSAIKHNPYSGQRCINPELSFMPYLCKKCTNGFSNKDNCLRHLQSQHVIDGGSILQHIATNKRLFEGYMTGMKDAREMLHKKQQFGVSKESSGPGGAIVPNIGSNASAFSRHIGGAPLANQIPTEFAIAYIATPPITAFMVKKEPVDNDQPLDFSMKKAQESQPQPCNYTTKPSQEDVAISDDMPLDLSVKPSGSSMHERKSRVASQNISMSSTESLSSAQSVPPVPSATHVNLCHHMKHIINTHPQVHTSMNKLAFGQSRLPNAHQFPNTTASAFPNCQESPGAGNNSDCDLSSVTKMLDCASSNFGAFFTPAEAPTQKQHMTSPQYPTHTPSHGRTSSPIVDMRDKRKDGLKFNMAANDGTGDMPLALTSPENTSDEPPANRKRNSYSDSPHKLQCPCCPRAFPWISSLKRHILTHTGQKPFKCPECPVTFSTKSNRERHMSRKHGLDIQDSAVRASMETPYKCHHCNMCFVSAAATKDHYGESHVGVAVPDYIIQQAKFELLGCSPGGSEKLIDGHLEAMSCVSDLSDQVGWASMGDFEDEEDEEMDGERMRTVMNTATALRASNSPSPVSQRVSPAMSHSFVSEANTSKGQAVMGDDDAPEYLTKINPVRDNYNVDRITGCWKCGLQFDSRKLLLRHLKDHNIDHSYKCYLCDASFESRVVCLKHTESVHRHDWVLLRDKNKCYEINIYASAVEAQVLETLANLGLNSDREEMEEGMKEQPQNASDDKANPDSDYAQRKVFCSFCVKRFWSLQDLRRHMRSHTGERPFECDICQKRFTLKHSMMRHRRKHTAAELAQASLNSTDVSPNTAHSDDEETTSKTQLNTSVLSGAFNYTSVAPKFRMAGPEETSPHDAVPVTSHQKSAMLSPALSGINLGEISGSSGVGNGDLLHNLLGVDSLQLDEMLQNREEAARMLGVGEK